MIEETRRSAYVEYAMIGSVKDKGEDDDLYRCSEDEEENCRIHGME